ncbi:hypothetical protein FGO68_gene88 [Halteria grandinella]|uniref:Uncharacterized protein n=1 Tax=Halteria grandinella TaxID=5974 RepID=A0A8J8SZP2_HALGN|nr:hypothetical protein FGO68_gene88 [Halteria grandinella]
MHALKINKMKPPQLNPSTPKTIKAPDLPFHVERHLTIDRIKALKQVDGNKELLASIFSTFLNQSVDRVVEKVSVAISYGYYKKGQDYVNGIIASSQFIQAYYLQLHSKTLRQMLQAQQSVDQLDLFKQYQIWIESLIYAKLTALDCMGLKDGFGESLMCLILLEDMTVVSCHRTGQFLCLRKGQTKEARIQELIESGNFNPALASDIGWILERNKYQPLKQVLKGSIKLLSQKKNDLETTMNNEIIMRDTVQENNYVSGCTCGMSSGTADQTSNCIIF